MLGIVQHRLNNFGDGKKADPTVEKSRDRHFVSGVESRGRRPTGAPSSVTECQTTERRDVGFIERQCLCGEIQILRRSLHPIGIGKSVLDR